MPDVPSTPNRLTLGQRVVAAFDPDGALAQAIDAFEPRTGQRDMALAVSDVLEAGGTLLAEAGTGTGKTLAYLIPAILSGQRVLISTGTKNLQEQIYFKDLPVLRDALGVAFRATYMKGRSNYLCLHRFEAACDDPSPRPAADHATLSLLKEWAAQTETGDRAELEDVPDDLPLWRDVSATQENCLGAECPQYDECHVTTMRQRAAESDVVIVNHHLLCADAAVRQSGYGEVIPEYTFVVVDEAHQLEDVATQYFGISVSTFRLEDLSRDAARALEGGGFGDPADGDALRTSLGRIREAARAFFIALLTDRGGAPARGEQRSRIDAARLEPVAELGHALVDALTVLESSVALLADAPEDLLAIARRAGEVRDDLRFVLRASEPAYVFFLELRNRGVFLRASPIDVSAIVREALWDRLRGGVLTSATLAVDGTFEYMRSRLGIGSAYELRLPSEFDFGQQTILYLPRRMPDPRDAAFTGAAGAEVVEILKHTLGRAFVLFTSYANLYGVRDIVTTARLDFPLLVQGTAPRSALLRDFRQTPNAVLLGTSSFWQGVDVVGEALSCVIIDKLPFASPGDPITAARIEALTARGDNPFADYQVPLAILSLQQGLGRLIRHRSDRGVLAILDPRIRTKGYGSRFLDSLPPAPITQDLAEIGRFVDTLA
ncbi:MAG: ATP-dependent DNA helicase [Vicinamibacterales bacterium]|nr:ATP-dependent DNA helicase [Vicinamibacterales bacterium]MDP7472894.1 ATP-dependent DNA helicase [Vicinamibacterales bacterium]MDP7671087.1 ATP-dependent DNA helicase [Vicinamibacterales bacterium]HJO39877.1 ATP-dependent DNA helicase [Vicinamibacterales bacterium]